MDPDKFDYGICTDSLVIVTWHQPAKFLPFHDGRKRVVRRGENFIAIKFGEGEELAYELISKITLH